MEKATTYPPLIHHLSATYPPLIRHLSATYPPLIRHLSKKTHINQKSLHLFEMWAFKSNSQKKLWVTSENH